MRPRVASPAYGRPVVRSPPPRRAGGLRLHPSPDLFPQVAMGYAHSLVIARDESEAEKEKVKKLPEYNPRTL